MSHFLSLFLIVMALCCCMVLTGCGAIYTYRYFRTLPESGTLLQTSKGKIFVTTSGNGTPVVYVHGNLGSHKDFTLSPLPAYLKDDFKVFAVDRYGAGYSKRPRTLQLSLEDHADILAEVITTLNLERPIIMGHSYGGAVSLMYALRHPQKLSGLVLLAPAAHDWEGAGVSEFRLMTAPVIGPLIMETVYIPWVGIILKKALASIFAPATVPADYTKATKETIYVPGHFVASARDMQIVRQGLGYIKQRYGDINIPTAVIAGSEDTITPLWNHADRLKAGLPWAQVQIISDAGHQVHFSHPTEVVAGLRWVKAQIETEQQ